jgi:hypothetical protein
MAQAVHEYLAHRLFMRQIGLGLIQNRVGSVLVSHQLPLVAPDKILRRVRPVPSAASGTGPWRSRGKRAHGNIPHPPGAGLARCDECRATDRATGRTGSSRGRGDGLAGLVRREFGLRRRQRCPGVVQ